VTWRTDATPARLERWLRELRRAVAWRRRLLVAGLLAGSMAFALHALAPPPPPGVQVLVAARDVAAGATLQSRDLRVESRPVGSVPHGSLRAPSDASGRPVVSAVRRGEVLTDVRLVGSAVLRGLGPGLVAAPVRVADAETVALLATGDVVDVLAANAEGGIEARLVAAGVRVLSVPRTSTSRFGAGLSDGALLLLATSSPTAARLAAAAVTDRLSVVVRGP
jgi:Flp pilus assembly protein CpaB